MARKRKRRIPAIVPQVVFGTAFIGVVPLCVATACNGSDSTSSSSGDFSVANMGYGVAGSSYGNGPPVGDAAGDADGDGSSDATSDGDGSNDATADSDGA